MSLLEELDTLTTLGIMGGLVFLTFFVLYKTVDNRYPKIKVLTLQGNILSYYIYRKLGNAIVRNDLMGILMNRFQFVGDIRLLKEYREPSFNKVTPVYIARLYNGFLFGYRDVENEDTVFVELDKSQKIDLINPETKKVQAEFTPSPNGMLFPVTFIKPEYQLEEKEINNGRTIGELFIEAMNNVDKQIKAHDPVMAVLIASLPMVLLVISIGIVLYLTLNEVMSNVVELSKVAQQIYEAARLARGE